MMMERRRVELRGPGCRVRHRRTFAPHLRALRPRPQARFILCPQPPTVKRLLIKLYATTPQNPLRANRERAKLSPEGELMAELINLQKAKKARSPSYPGIDLGLAVEKLRLFEKKE